MFAKGKRINAKPHKEGIALHRNGNFSGEKEFVQWSCRRKVCVRGREKACACVCTLRLVGATQHLEVMDCYSIPNRVGKVGGGFYWSAGKVL